MKNRDPGTRSVQIWREAEILIQIDRRKKTRAFILSFRKFARHWNLDCCSLWDLELQYVPHVFLLMDHFIHVKGQYWKYWTQEFRIHIYLHSSFYWWKSPIKKKCLIPRKWQPVHLGLISSDCFWVFAATLVFWIYSLQPLCTWIMTVQCAMCNVK